MGPIIEASADEYFVASKADFMHRAQAEGWSFWRGMVVGFLSGFPLAWIATHGELLPGIL